MNIGRSQATGCNTGFLLFRLPKNYHATLVFTIYHPIPKGSFTNDVIGLGGVGFQIMKADDGGMGLPKMTSFFTTILG